jgi:hypothetical protein
MAAQADLVHETSTTTGTGNFATSAVNGKQRFSDAGAFGTGATTNVFDYYISNRDAAGEWEHGTGHMSAAGTLVRDTVIAGSNGTSLVSFTAGTKDVTNDVPATEQLRKTNYLAEMAGHEKEARSSIYAAPFDALAFNGMQINGAMDVDQEHAGGAVSTPAGYVVDGWQVHKAGTMTIVAQQVADAPPGLSNSLKISVTNASGTLGATDYCVVHQSFEGFRTARLAFGTGNAQPISFGFWTKIHRAGTYGGVAYNGTGSQRSYPFTFTQNVADAWEFKTVTIPGDTSGSWVGATNGIGLQILLSLAAGSTYQGAAGAWSTNAYLGTSGQTNGTAATSDLFQVTGFILLPGLELPSASRAPFIMRPYDQEFENCQRYLWGIFGVGSAPLGIGYFQGSNPFGVTVFNPRTMRAAPSVVISGNWNMNQNGTPSALTALAAFNASQRSFEIGGSSAGSYSNGTAARMDSVDSSSVLKVDARL